MTVSIQTNRTSAVGSGAVGQVVPFTFPITDNSDIAVYQRVTATGVVSTLAETTNYTVTNNGESGGSITTVTAVAVTAEVHIVRSTPLTQSLDLTQGGAFNAENQEDAFDKLQRQIVDNRDRTNRSLRFPETDPTASLGNIPSSVDRKGYWLGFDSTTGTPTVGTPTDVTGTTISAFMETVLDDASAAAAMATMNGIPVFNVKNPVYGAVGDGVTDDSAAIQAAIDAAEAAGGGIVVFPSDADVYCLDNNITVGSNIHIYFRGTFSTNQTGAGLPSAFLTLEGDNILIDGFRMELATGPFIVHAGGAGRWMILSDTSNVVIQNCTVKNVYYCIQGYGVANDYSVLTNIVIRDNVFSAVRAEIWLNGITGSDCLIENNVITGAKDWTSPVESRGEIWVFGSHARETDTDFDDTDYAAPYDDLRILNNTIAASNFRPISVGNITNLVLANNTVNGVAGTYATTGVSHDSITLDMVRQGKVHGNTVNASGENGIDILSCREMVITGNILRQIDTDGVALLYSDICADLSETLSAHYLENMDIKFSNNYIAASQVAIEVFLASNVNLTNNIIGKYWNGRTDKEDRYDLIMDDSGTEATNDLIGMIDLAGTTKVRVGQTLLEANMASNTFRTAVAHRLVTGDRIELYALGSDTIPSALDTDTDYYAIRSSETDFQIATTWANATAGTAVTFSDDESGTCYVEEVRMGRIRYADTWAYGERVRLPLDLTDVRPSKAARRAIHREIESVDHRLELNSYFHDQQISDLTSSGPAYYFDGTNDEIAVADSAHLDPGTQDSTFQVLFKMLEANTGTVYIAGRGSNSSNQMVMIFDGTSTILAPSFRVGGVYMAQQAATVHLESDAWYDWTWTIDNGVSNTSYINGIAKTNDITNVNTGGDMSLAQEFTLGQGGLDTNYGNVEIALFRQWNKALTASEVKAFASGAPIPYKYIGANQTELTSGTLTVGKAYRINTFVAGDDFTNVGASSNATGVEFVATGTTPTTWTNSSALVQIGVTLQLDNDSMSPTTWYDKSGNALNGTVTGAVLTNPPASLYTTGPATVGGLVHTFTTLANDATPSVSGHTMFLTGGTTTITDFDDGVTGQIITVIAEHSLTITDGTNIFLNGSANWAMTATDTLTLIQKADGLWYELSRGDNGA